ncbi:hypothetical protein ACWCXX_40930 [Streptomyces sp. NPDC001732]
MVPVRDGRGGCAGVAVQPGGQFCDLGAEDQQFAPQAGGGGVDRCEDAQQGGQRLVRAVRPVGAGGVVQRGP